MSGTTIIAHLLGADGLLTAVVPRASIKEDRLPDSITLPALLVREISGSEWQGLTRGDSVPTTNRVSVTVRAASTRQRKQIMPLVRAACAGRTGTIAGFGSVAVLTAGSGPAVIGPGDSYEQAQDFRVAFDAHISTGA